MTRNYMLGVIVFCSILLGCGENTISSRSDSEFSAKGEEFFNSSTEGGTESDKIKEGGKSDLKKNTAKAKGILKHSGQPIIYDYDNENLYLAATKLCWDVDYTKVFGYERTKVSFGSQEFKNGEQKIDANNSCLAFIPSPYINPMEYYYHLYHGYTAIQENTTNTFKLKRLRTELHEKNSEGFKKKVFEVDPQNLSSFTMVRATVQNYDFETNKLYISYSTNRQARLKRRSVLANIKPFGKKHQIFYSYFMPMSEQDGSNLYKFYSKNDELNKNPPFNLVTKTTYSLNFPEKQVRPYLFDIKIKKIEFFKKKEDMFIAENKIGELTF